MKFAERFHYEGFVEDFAEQLKGKNICFYLFGSYTRGLDFIPGRSDLDGGLIVDSNFVIRPNEITSLSKSMEELLIKWEVIAQCPLRRGLSVGLNLTDRATNRDGRFLSYDDEYTDYLKKRAVIVTGPNFVNELNGLNYKRDCLRSASHNLREVRNGLLMHFYRMRTDKEKAGRSILHSLNVLRSTPKKLLSAARKELDFDRDNYFKSFMELFPDYDRREYDRVQYYRKNPENYYKILRDKRKFQYALGFLNATERMVEAYVTKFPVHSRHEIRMH